MQRLLSRLRGTQRGAWFAVAALVIVIIALPPALRARAAGEHDHGVAPCAIEHDDGADDHAAGDDEEIVELSDEAMALAGLETVPVSEREMSDWLRAPAVVHANPDGTALVSPPIAGTVESVSASPGDRVGRGQVLAVIRSPEVAIAQADVAAATAELQAAADALRRRQALADAGEFGAAPYEDARRAHEQAQQQVRLAETRLQQVRRLSELGAQTQPPREDAAYSLAQAREEVQVAEAELSLAGSALATAERAVGRAQTGSGRAALAAAADAAVSEAEVGLKTAQANVRRLEGLVPDGLATQQELDAAGAQEATAKTRLETARYELRTVDEAADRARIELDAARRDLANAHSALQAARDRLSLAEGRHGREKTVADERISARAQVAEAETELKSARAALEHSKSAWEREQRLHRSGTRPQEALADLHGAVASARARLTAARRHVEALGHGRQSSGGRVSITAPVSGKVSVRGARVGAVVHPGETLLEITGIESVWVEAGFYEKDVPLLAAGQPARMRVVAFPEDVFETYVHSLDPVLDERTRKLTVRGIIDNTGGRLLPDMAGELSVRVGTAESALAVPEKAVQNDGHCDFVFVEQEHGRFRRVEVEAGARSDGMIEIRSGLRVGLHVVTEGAFLLKAEMSEIAASCGHGH